jgi:hypothetical protein
VGRLDGHPLGQEHAEGRQHHGHDPHGGDHRRVRHDPEQAAHVLDVPAADFLLDEPHAQKQQGLGHGVEDDQQDGRGDGRRGVDAGAGDDQGRLEMVE